MAKGFEMYSGVPVQFYVLITLQYYRVTVTLQHIFLSYHRQLYGNITKVYGTHYMGT